MSKNKKGLLIIFSGPSGSGKGTIMKSLLASRDDTVLSVSMTTRAPRPGEIDGYHYHFVTHEVFQRPSRRMVFWNMLNITVTSTALPRLLSVAC